MCLRVRVRDERTDPSVSALTLARAAVYVTVVITGRPTHSRSHSK